MMRRPRLRFDGIYAAKVSYYRMGRAEFVFYAPYLKVEYWRYLRFFENGNVVWMRSFDAPYSKDTEDKSYVWGK